MFKAFVRRSLNPWGDNASADEGHLIFNIFCVALFLIHSIWEQVPNSRSKQLSAFGIIFTHMSFTKGGESNFKGLFHSKYPFLAIHAKGGESISPKQKDRTTTT